MLTTTKKQCAPIITNCQYLNDATPSQCDTCNTNFMLTTGKIKCGSIISNCQYLNDATPTLCDSCESSLFTLT